MNKSTYISIAAIVLAVIAIGVTFMPKATAPATYGGVIAATCSNANSTSTTVTVGTGTSTIVIAQNPHISSWEVDNLSANAVYLDYAAPAATGTGILVNPQASSTKTYARQDYPSVFTGNLYGIAGASSTLSVSYCWGN